MSVIDVSLSPDEVLQAAMTGVMRYTQNMRMGRQNAYGADRSRDHGMWLSIFGSMGEAAVAKATNRYHFGLGVFRGDDVSGCQVRATKMASGNLILHEKDKQHNATTPFVSVLHLGKEDGVEKFRLQGWGYPEDLARQEFWSDPTGQNRPAYFVPVESLEGMETFPGCLSNLPSPSPS
jgi:hypothetical protein